MFHLKKELKTRRHKLALVSQGNGVMNYWIAVLFLEDAEAVADENQVRRH
jgi:hypothetical protein